jgi:hypothetical protein
VTRLLSKTSTHLPSSARHAESRLGKDHPARMQSCRLRGRFTVRIWDSSDGRQLKVLSDPTSETLGRRLVQPRRPASHDHERRWDSTNLECRRATWCTSSVSPDAAACRTPPSAAMARSSSPAQVATPASGARRPVRSSRNFSMGSLFATAGSAPTAAKSSPLVPIGRPGSYQSSWRAGSRIQCGSRSSG